VYSVSLHRRWGWNRIEERREKWMRGEEIFMAKVEDQLLWYNISC
jgi:hypothetical protein